MIKSNNRVNYYNIKDELKKFITDYYKLFNLDINVNYNNILLYISNILVNYGLILNKIYNKTKNKDGIQMTDYKFEILFKD